MNKKLEQIIGEFNMKFVFDTLADYDIQHTTIPQIDTQFYYGFQDPYLKKIFINHK